MDERDAKLEGVAGFALAYVLCLLTVAALAWPVLASADLERAWDAWMVRLLVLHCGPGFLAVLVIAVAQVGRGGAFAAGVMLTATSTTLVASIVSSLILLAAVRSDPQGPIALMFWPIVTWSAVAMIMGGALALVLAKRRRIE